MPTDRKGSALEELVSYPVPGDINFIVLDLGEVALFDQNKRTKLTTLDARFATAAQGALADSAVQPGDLATVATSGAYADLSGLPTLGTLAALNSPLPIANGGSGQVSQQAAIDALTAVAAATNEHVLTKDTVSGNAVWKAASGGAALTVQEVDGAPSVANVDTIVVSNGTLTDDGGGQVTITTGGGGGSSLPVVDETAIVYKTGDVAITQTHNVDAYTVARVVTWPNAAMTVAGLEVANVFTEAQDIQRNFSGAEADNLLNIVSVWNTSGTCKGLSFTITNTASNANSALFEMIEGSNVLFKLYTTGAFDCQAVSSAITNDGRGSANRISLINPNTTNNNYSTIRFGDSNSDVSAWIAARHIDHGNNYADLFFGTQGADGAVVRMIITSAGRIGVGDRVVSPAARLHVDQPSATGAIPVLTLDQADIDEDFISFIGTSDSGSTDRSLIKPSEFPTPGAITAWLKCKITDTRVGGIGTIDGWVPVYAAPT